jgi:hypothetical protein
MISAVRRGRFVGGLVKKPLAAPDRRGADPGPRGVTHMTDLGAKT